jgi:recombination protein RecA
LEIQTMAKTRTKKKTTKKRTTKKAPKKGDPKLVVSALDIIAAKYGKGAAAQGTAGKIGDYQTISTGSIRLDRATGIGGIPRGRIVEIYGPESSGKTTLTLHFIANAQKQGVKAAFIDAEHAFDPNYAKAIGVDLSTLVYSQPDSGEQALDVATILASTGEYGLIVIDSVAALTPQAEIDGEVGKSHVGLQARLMGQTMRKLTAVASKAKTSVVFINQLRMKIGVMFGSPETTTGGNALKFYASMRFDCRRIGTAKEGDAKVANETRVKVVKNKCAPPWKEAEFDIRYGIGIDTIAELLDEAVEADAIEKNGAFFRFDGEIIGQGRARAVDAMREDPDLEAAIRERLAAAEQAPAA